ncbi:fibronectin type III domain-containing protein [Bdellovibrio sp. SKB1291214]|uniref:fibronectin type III domain-containing protein n=1 Tax=Bdellovibrio sp. SKB1291214 TaxID=1732569 RepID=UPI000B517A70|nr:fibronectin type III domain-containing protein [Bdellovibrio sp. SKB1291214]UYL08603.1 fibronectin type III domain-containing protein [Bdellovibrio sp. SKB1291214]
MKIFASLIAFAFTLALTAPVVASEGHSGPNIHTKEELGKKMNSLFPPKQMDKEAQTVPAKPELTSPEYFAAIKGETVTLKWKEAKDAQEYHVQVATDANFKWLVAEDQHVKATTFDVAKLEAGKHYFWRVASVRPNNWSTFRKSYFAMSMFETPGAATVPAAGEPKAPAADTPAK